MKQKLKTLLISGVTVVSSWLSAHAQNETSGENDSIRTENVRLPESKNKNDVLQVASAESNVSPTDTLARAQAMRQSLTQKDTIETATAADSLKTGPIGGMDQLRFDAFCLIAHWEDIRVYPYRCKIKGKTEPFYTYGIGNTTTETGAKVRPSDYIKSVEHLMENFLVVLDNDMISSMNQYLPVDSMTNNEKCAMLSLAWNCGPKALEKAAPMVREYCRTRNDPKAHAIAAEKVKKEFMRHIYAQGSRVESLERRRLGELDIFFENVIMKNNEVCTAPNEIDLYNSPIGASNGAYKKTAGRIPTIDERCYKINNCQYGDSIPDTITRELRKGPPAQKAVRRTPQKAGQKIQSGRRGR